MKYRNASLVLRSCEYFQFFGAEKVQYLLRWSTCRCDDDSTVIFHMVIDNASSTAHRVFELSCIIFWIRCILPQGERVWINCMSGFYPKNILLGILYELALLPSILSLPSNVIMGSRVLKLVKTYLPANKYAATPPGWSGSVSVCVSLVPCSNNACNTFLTVSKVKFLPLGLPAFKSLNCSVLTSDFYSD